jgi:DNA-binding NtrC family response regulator
VQETRVMRVGSTRETPVDVHIVTATHRDLTAMVAQGSFRQDLLYRLNTVVLEVPPLRERRSEVPELAAQFLDEVRAQWHGSARSISAEALALLESYHWPGNVRELRNVIERAVALCDRDAIEPIDLPACLRGAAGERQENAAAANASPAPAETGVLDDALFRDRVRDYECGLIRDALEKARGNAPRAAELLRIPIRTLTYKMKAHGIRES